VASLSVDPQSPKKLLPNLAGALIGRHVPDESKGRECAIEGRNQQTSQME
jgi:hypothetical protein